MSWKTIKLGTVIEVIMGQAPPGKDCNFNAIGTPFVKAGEFGKYSPVIREWTTKPLKLGKKSDIFLCVVGATCGKINYGEDCAIGRSVSALRPIRDLIEQKYLYYFMSLMVKKLRDGSQGAAQTVISKEMINRIPILLPPITIQRKIVAKLDTVFGEIDKAIAATEANVKNADALFHCYLRKAFEINSASWNETTLGKSFELYQPQTITTKELKEDGKYEVYGANGVIGHYDKYNHEDSQLLVTCRGATCGAVNVSSPYAWINGNAMVVKPKTKDIDIRFIEYFFRGVVNLIKAITGAAQPQITRQSLSPIIFHYPSLANQQKIVAELDVLSRATAKSIKSYKSKSNELTVLKQSILKYAFAGDLVEE